MISFSNATIQSVTHPPCKRTRPCAVRFLVAANGCRARPLLALQAGPTILFIVVWLSGCFFGSNAADTPHRPKSVSALIVDHYRLAACFRLNVRSLIDTWKGLQMQGRSGTRPFVKPTASGPNRSLTHRLACCGAARRTSHSLQVHNRAVRERVTCGLSELSLRSVRTAAFRLLFQCCSGGQTSLRLST